MLIRSQPFIYVILSCLLASTSGGKATVLSNRRNLLKVFTDDQRYHPRIKRQVPSHGVSAANIEVVLDAHNGYRRMEPALNMHVMRWNDDLARAAKDWTDRCIWIHGQPDLNLYGLDPNIKLGQNNYVSSSFDNAQFHFNESVYLWWDEIKWYDYDTSTCSAPPDDSCIHYTQVVWAKTEEVGCGLTICPTITVGNITYTNAPFIVCNYSPVGNAPGEKPYEIDPNMSCLECFGTGFVSDGLCDSQCTLADPDCTCPLDCGFCGMVDNSTCTCQCVSGYYDYKCDKKCEDTPVIIGDQVLSCSTFPLSNPSNCLSSLLMEHCPAYCGLCTMGNGLCFNETTTTPTTTSTTSTSTTTTPTITTTTPTTTSSMTTTTPETTTTTVTPTPTSTTTLTTTTTVIPALTSGPFSPPAIKFYLDIIAFPPYLVWKKVHKTLWSIRKSLSKSLNKHCLHAPDICCGTTSNQSLTGQDHLAFTTPHYIYPAKSYPKDTLHMSHGDLLETVTFRMIATGAPGNSLCAVARLHQRQRRSISSDQDALPTGHKRRLLMYDEDLQELRSFISIYNITLLYYPHTVQ